MTLLIWVTLFLAVSITGEFAGPSLRNRFPWNLAQAHSSDSRALLFLRILCSSVVFGGILGLAAGLIATAVSLLRS
jgi:hypothetical protein